MSVKYFLTNLFFKLLLPSLYVKEGKPFAWSGAWNLFLGFTLEMASLKALSEEKAETALLSNW